MALLGGLELSDEIKNWFEHFESWIRLEPRCRADDFTEGLEARTADPLWMLARQWQTGELNGEDAGSPIAVTIEYETQTPERFRAGNAEASAALASNGVYQPLEPLVEQEQLPLTYRDRVMLGQVFEQRVLARLGADAPALIHAVRLQCPLRLPSRDAWEQLDRATRRMLRFAAGRIPDGQALLLALASDQPPPGGRGLLLPTGVTADQRAGVKAELDAYCQRMNLRANAERPAAWRNQQLDYHFGIDPAPVGTEAPDKTHLVAPDYRNGDLSWHSFNIVRQGKLWSPQAPVATLPAPIQVGGTSPRWWEFEDGAINIGAIDVDKPELGKLALLEFMLVYGDDWFTAPVSVQLPNLVRITKVEVHNVFGESTPIPPARVAPPDALADPLRRFELFTLSPTTGADPSGVSDTHSPGAAGVLWLPPQAGDRTESPPLEEIHFLRDESANLVWAVEHRIRNGLGRSIDGYDAQRERIARRVEEETFHLQTELSAIVAALQAPDLPAAERPALRERRSAIEQRLTRLREGPPISSDALPRFRLATSVPEHWIPFAPMTYQLTPERHHIRLRRAQMLRNVDDEDPTPIAALSRLMEMEDDPVLWLEEATVPRSGLRLQLTAQRMRWVDGSTHVWVGRKVLAGRGEGSSGLRFDVTTTIGGR